jgi:hypothetical protein
MLIRIVQHKDWANKFMRLEDKTISDCARLASERFNDPGPWIVSDEHCNHEITCERVTEWRVVNLRGSAEGE